MCHFKESRYKLLGLSNYYQFKCILQFKCTWIFNVLSCLQYFLTYCILVQRGTIHGQGVKHRIMARGGTRLHEA